MSGMYETMAWGKTAKDAKFSKFSIKRNVAGPEDVTFDVKYCGVCHTDVHFANNDMGHTKYPIVPGHELAGIVTAVGAKVTKYKVGDRVGVGCISDSCMACDSCSDSLEQFCDKTFTMTYDSPVEHGHMQTDSGYSYGGYCDSFTANQRYIVDIPPAYPLEAAGPLFCAAITMYSPLAHWGALNGGKKVGIIGIGGLGQMGVRLAKAMGNEVTAISTSPNKKQTAMDIGADKFIVSSNPESLKAGDNSLDLILNTVAANHQLSTYVPLMRRDGCIVQLGVVSSDHLLQQFSLMPKRLSICGSLIGGMSETQGCMDFCAKNKIIPTTKIVKAAELDDIYTKLINKNDQVIRYVLDIDASK